MKKVLAFDLGASSGRAMLGVLDEGKITIEEIHRFSNDPVTINGTMYWDVLRLLFEIKHSIAKTKGHKINSIGIATWGVDFGLLDKNGDLLANPVHYRDARTQGMLEKAFEKIPRDELFSVTGNQFMELNTIYQLLSLQQKGSHILENAHTMLLMPDLFNYFLTGKMKTEQSIASTTQLYDSQEKRWSAKIIDALGLPARLFTDIVPSGTVIGQTSEEVNSQLGIELIDVIAVAGHDTQSAMVSIPTTEEDFVFLSCGTWSLLGTETPAPIISAQARKYNMNNEAAYGGKNAFLKNIGGLWLLQESKRQWAKEGQHFTFSQLEAMAKSYKPFECGIVDSDAEVFIAEGDIPTRIRQYCKQKGQHIPQSPGEVARCINDSLALKYKQALEEIETCTGKKYPTIYMVGGGIQSALLCQSTADVCGRPVYAGPVEATVLGNVAVQLMAAGVIKSLNDAREVIRNSQEIVVYNGGN